MLNGKLFSIFKIYFLLNGPDPPGGPRESLQPTGRPPPLSVVGPARRGEKSLIPRARALFWPPAPIPAPRRAKNL
jgi:hypothetical protein